MRRKNKSWDYYRQSDPAFNRQWRRDWSDTAVKAKRRSEHAVKEAAKRAPPAKTA